MSNLEMGFDALNAELDLMDQTARAVMTQMKSTLNDIGTRSPEEIRELLPEVSRIAHDFAKSQDEAYQTIGDALQTMLSRIAEARVSTTQFMVTTSSAGGLPAVEQTQSMQNHIEAERGNTHLRLVE